MKKQRFANDHFRSCELCLPGSCAAVNIRRTGGEQNRHLVRKQLQAIRFWYWQIGTCFWNMLNFEQWYSWIDCDVTQKTNSEVGVCKLNNTVCCWLLECQVILYLKKNLCFPQLVFRCFSGDNWFRYFSNFLIPLLERGSLLSCCSYRKRWLYFIKMQHQAVRTETTKKDYNALYCYKRTCKIIHLQAFLNVHASCLQHEANVIIWIVGKPIFF